MSQIAPKMHRPSLQLPSTIRYYSWGRVEVWLRGPGECLDMGHAVIHALGCSEDRTEADHGSVIWRATSRNGRVIATGCEALIATPQAFFRDSVAGRV